MKNPYLPSPMRVERVEVETEDRNIKTFALSFANGGDETDFNYVPGQFAELSVLGKGEAPFGMASSPTQAGCLEFTVNKAGVLTTALHNMEPGDIVGVRGPLGNGYPLEQLEGANIVIIGGGFGFSTLRALTNFMLAEHNRSKFRDITVIYGARNPGLVLYKDELQEWGKRDDLNLCMTVDSANGDWNGKVGLIPNITREISPSADNSYALVCGPPVMIRTCVEVLQKLRFAPDHILTSLEMKMKCGIGKCGRCNIGSKYVCKDGPVFTYAQLQRLSAEY